jgi:hypothetical protein
MYWKGYAMKSYITHKFLFYNHLAVDLFWITRLFEMKNEYFLLIRLILIIIKEGNITTVQSEIGG